MGYDVDLESGKKEGFEFWVFCWQSEGLFDEISVYIHS